ncbi:MAG TPA: methyltransferase [Microbacterium sp.]|uniref:methyltransferase n=1 Tax=Microbacterium sp. TaxID=51671 RepID=UPI002C333DFD|nr:methyltransferase [Microbacterium sp.]HWI30370.1 methyltransferase [Microbacterium sp.]
MTNTQTHRLWVAHGPAGAVGTIQQEGDDYTVRMIGRDAPAGTYPTMEVAKNALFSQLKPGSAWPEFREH